MESKEGFTGLEKYSIPELEQGAETADRTGYWKGVPQGIIDQELSKRRQLTEQTSLVETAETTSLPITQKPKRTKRGKRGKDIGAQQRFLIDQQAEYLGGPDYGRRLANINRNKR